MTNKAHTNQRRILSTLAILPFLFFQHKALAAGEKNVESVPLTIPGAVVLSIDEAGKLVEQNRITKDESEKTLFVDVRKLIEFSEEHIPGAIHVPYKEKSEKTLKFDPKQDEFDTGFLATTKAKKIVFYCNGDKCWKSYKACLWLTKEKKDFKILWLRDGIPGWKEKKLPVEAGIKKST